MEFPILFQDDHFVAIEKPAGIMVHRQGRSDDRTVVLQELRNQLGRHVFPVHRLDRGTSGVLVFALSAESAAAFQQCIELESSKKIYLAIVRGWLPEKGSIDHPLEKDGDGPLQDALTTFQCLQKAEIPIAVDRYATARYSFAAIRIFTGRMHQIRRHFAHLRHPILGDKKRGDRHHNRAWAEHFQMETMCLLSRQMEFVHPYSKELLRFQANPNAEFSRAMKILRFEMPEILDL